MRPVALKLHSISKSFENQPVLNKVSIELSAGEIAVLVGESGSGKTTLMRTIAGLNVPDSGDVYLNGVLCTAVPARKRNCGLVFQDYALFPHLTVEKNIAFGMHGASREQKMDTVSQLLEWIGLPDFQKRYPHQLSGGQQQRVAIARALAPAPAIVLFDEPFSNLDPIRKSALRAQIKELIRASNTTALIVTHDSNDAVQIADSIHVIQHGSIIQSGSPESVKNAPINDYVAAIVN